MTKKNWKNLPLKFYNFLIIGFVILSHLSVAEKLYRADETPQPLQNISVKENLGQAINLDLIFVSEEGKSLALKKYFQSKPVLMTVIYYNCPSLCNFHLNGLFEALQKLPTALSNSYELVIVSMDSNEKAPLAKEKKQNYLRKFKLKKEQIHFLTGSEKSIKTLTENLGFSFRWDEETEQFAHSPVAYALTPEALISRYLYGVEFPSKTLKLALLEAGSGKIGNVIDRILLFCYRFNSKANKYGLYAYNIMRIAGILMILGLLLLLLPFWIKQGKLKNKNV